MKFLHLSDLHIGKSVNGFSMLDEQRHAFAQILAYLDSERPDAVVIAGDIYDRAVPGVEAVRVFDDFLTELTGAGVAVMLVPGNHDSPERLSFASRLLADKRLFIFGRSGAIERVTLADEYGNVHFYLLPFVKPAMVRGLFRSAGREESEPQMSTEDAETLYNSIETLSSQENSGQQQDGAASQRETIDTYGAAVSALLSSADIDYGARNVLVSHQFYTRAGVTPERSESELSPIGGLDAVDSGLIAGFDYAALGHLHGRQSVGAEHIRYSGSPVKYSFSEWRQSKSVFLVELKEKGDLTVTPLPLAALHDMREIRGELDTLLSEEISEQADARDYLRVVLTDEDELIDPLGKLRSIYPNIMSLGFDNARTQIEADSISSSIQSVETLSQYDLFCEFFLETQGSVMTAEQAEIVSGILDAGAAQEDGQA